jgi:hypothetical protein
MTAHPPLPVNGLGPPNEHLLRIATAKRARSAERLLIDDGNAPARVPYARSGNHGSGPGSDDHQIEIHRWPPAPRMKLDRLQVPVARANAAVGWNLQVFILTDRLDWGATCCKKEHLKIQAEARTAAKVRRPCGELARRLVMSKRYGVTHSVLWGSVCPCMALVSVQCTDAAK